MIELPESDLFMKYLNHDNVIFGRIGKITSGAESSLVVLNDYLINDIKKKIVENKKTPSVTAMGNAVQNKKIVLIKTAPDKALPEMLPFIIGKDRNTGRRFAYVNMNPIVRIEKTANGAEMYELGDANKAYTTLYSAYLAMDKFEKNAVLSSNLIYNSAVIWADIFNKPLYDAFGMNNPERNQALMYFAIQFFLRYIMEIKEESQVESITRKYIGGKKNDLILFMEDQIDSMQLKPFSGLIPYMDTIFNNEVTQIKGIRVANIENTMNSRFYLQRYTTTYGSSALLALCTFPYFVYAVVSAYGKSKMVKDKAFDRVFSMHKKETLAFITALLSQD